MYREKFEKLYEHYITIIGSAGHFLFIFQTFKTIQVGSAHDVSLGGFIVSFFSLISWLFYGFLKKDRPLIIANLVGASLALICITTIIFFKYGNG